MSQIIGILSQTIESHCTIVEKSAELLTCLEEQLAEERESTWVTKVPLRWESTVLHTEKKIGNLNLE